MGRKATSFYPFSLQCTCACKYIYTHTDTQQSVSTVKGTCLFEVDMPESCSFTDAEWDTAQKKREDLSRWPVFIYIFLWMCVQSAETGVKQRSAAFSDSLIYRTPANALIQGGEVSERDSAETRTTRLQDGRRFPKVKWRVCLEKKKKIRTKPQKNNLFLFFFNTWQSCHQLLVNKRLKRSTARYAQFLRHCSNSLYN